MGRPSRPAEPPAEPVHSDEPAAGTGPAVNADTGQVTQPGDALPPIEGQDEPAADAPQPLTEEQLEERRAARIAEAKAELAPAKPEGNEDAPVYDERGNVRPRGTPGAKAMTYAQRVAIAKRLAAQD
ncbi:MAG: hypothetical protein IE926_05745 [Micrococcales bacterium]|nr:hypothetical protein [Micrococcales bacterium]